jgi:pyruvate formate-lyase activating enzyme-like uncharacterized protein
MKSTIERSEGGSLYIGNLPLGCQMCMRGQKLVLFIGGKCQKPARCQWYCPISESRKDSDQIYADEIKIISPDEVIEEAKLIQARGSSITGGDPLSSDDHIELTLFYLEELKNAYTTNFHIHLYTNGKNLTPEIAVRLAKSGLDEIRFHPAEEDFHKIEYAMDLGMDVGAEVPVIPNPENEEYIWNLIDYMDNIGANFVNLNEFEMNDPNHKSLQEKGFELVEGTMATVKGSWDLGMKILNNYPDRYNISLHLCPVGLKDGPQLRNRYKRRAESIQKPFEEITEDGTLLFLKVEGNKSDLQALYNELLRERGVPKKMMELNLTDKTPKLNLPWFLSEEKYFAQTLEDHTLTGGIAEILPFRGEYAELCEFTPIKKPGKKREMKEKS